MTNKFTWRNISNDELLKILQSDYSMYPGLQVVTEKNTKIWYNQFPNLAMMCEFNNTPLANVVMVHIIILNNKNVYKFLNIIITQIVKILNRHVKILRQSIPKLIIIILFQLSQYLLRIKANLFQVVNIQQQNYSLNNNFAQKYQRLQIIIQFKQMFKKKARFYLVITQISKISIVKKLFTDKKQFKQLQKVPLNQESFENLKNGKIQESDILEEQVFDKNKHKSVGFHIYHLEKYSTCPQDFRLYKEWINYLKITLDQNFSKTDICGFTAYCVTLQGINYFENVLKFTQSMILELLVIHNNNIIKIIKYDQDNEPENDQVKLQPCIMFYSKGHEIFKLL